MYSRTSCIWQETAVTGIENTTAKFLAFWFSPRVWQNVRYELLNRSPLRTVKALDTAQENKLACDGKSQPVLRF